MRKARRIATRRVRKVVARGCVPRIGSPAPQREGLSPSLVARHARYLALTEHDAKNKGGRRLRLCVRGGRARARSDCAPEPPRGFAQVLRNDARAALPELYSDGFLDGGEAGGVYCQVGRPPNGSELLALSLVAAAARRRPMLALELAAAVQHLLASRAAREWRRRGVAHSAAL